jgi:hypothetical protein
MGGTGLGNTNGSVGGKQEIGDIEETEAADHTEGEVTPVKPKRNSRKTETHIS